MHTLVTLLILKAAIRLIVLTFRCMGFHSAYVRATVLASHTFKRLKCKKRGEKEEKKRRAMTHLDSNRVTKLTIDSVLLFTPGVASYS